MTGFWAPVKPRNLGARPPTAAPGRCLIMDSDAHLDGLVAPLRDDVVSGASVLGRTAADVIRRASVRLQAGSLVELRLGLGGVCQRVLDAQPAMAPLIALVRDVMDAVESAPSLEAGRHAAASAADRFRNDFDERARRVRLAAVDVLPAGGTVATISSSATLRTIFATEAQPRGITVLCFESRPMNEGRHFAEALAAAGVDVMYAVDAAAPSLVPGCDAVMLGADSIGDLGVINKIGSAMIARIARAARIPVYIVADETKILPRGFPQVIDDDRPPAEVWAAPAGVRVWNRYFETTPLDFVTAVVTERGVLDLAALEATRGAIDMPAGLRAWASGRAQASEP